MKYTPKNRGPAKCFQIAQIWNYPVQIHLLCAKSEIILSKYTYFARWCITCMPHFLPIILVYIDIIAIVLVYIDISFHHNLTWIQRTRLTNPAQSRLPESIMDLKMCDKQARWMNCAYDYYHIFLFLVLFVCKWPISNQLGLRQAIFCFCFVP